MKLLAAGPDGRSSQDGRKVRTPQSSVPDNVREDTRACTGGIVRRKVPQKTYRPGRKAQVRVKRCGKSAPPPAVMRRAGQTPHGARPNREGFPGKLRFRRRACRLGAPQPPGRSLEPRSNAWPRGMTVLPETADRIRLTGPAATIYPSIFAMLWGFATPGHHAHRLMSRDLGWAFAPATSSQVGVPSRESTANYLWTQHS